MVIGRLDCHFYVLYVNEIIFQSRKVDQFKRFFDLSMESHLERVGNDHTLGIFCVLH